MPFNGDFPVKHLTFSLIAHKETVMTETLWKPSEERIKNSNMKRFMAYVNGRYDTAFEDYFDLYDWSVERIPDL
jgi:acetoacetyl-CoA synthetase